MRKVEAGRVGVGVARTVAQEKRDAHGPWAPWNKTRDRRDGRLAASELHAFTSRLLFFFFEGSYLCDCPSGV